ncbi:MAG: hypothetical protein KAS63_08830 [Candidatus Heimdallarchaeota archaeon]|nr:hypothetical protein [Candidatus Heimdallarchaeota archaeon]MCK4955452.1 hypothetical protein [Candidatus Heimdallarchaeota archaeon]
MELSEIIEEFRTFLSERQWLDFSAQDVFIHLIEELSEIGKYLLFSTGYKKEDMGHEKPSLENLPKEFAQAFSLFLQLCILLDINLEEAWKEEIKFMRQRFPSNDKYK